MHLNHLVNETLTRALPYLSEKRRELVVNFIMTNKFNEGLWYSHGECTLDKPTGSINARTVRLIKDSICFLNSTRQALKNLNRAIDDYEYSRNLQDG